MASEPPTMPPLLPSLTAAISRACSSTFSGLEILSPPRNWPGAFSHIAVLDSSFNPPTRAHLAIAASQFPDHTLHPDHSTHPNRSTHYSTHPGPYTARLLLYSPKNADKIPGSGDASVGQRVSMMLAQARALSSMTGNVAVGLVSAPTFVGKAQKLIAELGDHSPALTFLVGTDTLVRIFDIKYYGTEEQMRAALEALFAHSWLVSVRRGDEEDVAAEEQLLASPIAQHWVAVGKVRVLEKLPEVAGVSSSAVRAAVKEGKGLADLVVREVAEMVLSEGLYR